MQETQVWSLDQENPLEKEMTTHSSILAWEIPRTEELGGLQSMGSQRVGHDLQTKQQVILYFLVSNQNSSLFIGISICPLITWKPQAQILDNKSITVRT